MHRQPCIRQERGACSRMLPEPRTSRARNAQERERIAKHCHVSPGFVSKLVAERRASLHREEIKPSVRTVERGGKKYQPDTSRIGKKAAVESDSTKTLRSAALSNLQSPWRSRFHCRRSQIM